MKTSFHFRSLLSSAGVLLLVAEGAAQDIALLLQQMGSPHYRTRENAFRVLQKEVHRADVFERLQGPFRDPEIDHRAYNLREEYVNSLKPANLPTLPWIDMLPGTGYPGADKIMCDYLARCGGHGRSPLWIGDMEATRLWVRDLVAQRVPRSQIMAALNAMGEVQKKSTYYNEYLRALEK